MLLWSFETYVSPTGRADVQASIDGFDDYGSQSLQRQIEHLSVTEIKGWDEPQAKKLKNEDPIYEIRFKANRRSTRALGYFRKQRKNVFVIVLICYHKGSVYTPANAFESAHTRIKQIENGSASTSPLTIDGESFPQDAEERHRP